METFTSFSTIVLPEIPVGFSRFLWRLHLLLENVASVRFFAFHLRFRCTEVNDSTGVGAAKSPHKDKEKPPKILNHLWKDIISSRWL